MIENIYNSHLITVLSSISSIIGFLLTLFLLYQGSKFKKKYLQISNMKKFNENRTDHRNKLIAYRDLIAQNKVLDIKLISNINEEVSNYGNYEGIPTLGDRIRILSIKIHLSKSIGKIDQKKLCNQIAHFISRYNMDMEGML